MAYPFPIPFEIGKGGRDGKVSNYLDILIVIYTWTSSKFTEMLPLICTIHYIFLDHPHFSNRFDMVFSIYTQLHRLN